MMREIKKWKAYLTQQRTNSIDAMEQSHRRDYLLAALRYRTIDSQGAVYGRFSPFKNLLPIIGFAALTVNPTFITLALVMFAVLLVLARALNNYAMYKYERSLSFPFRAYFLAYTLMQAGETNPLRIALYNYYVNYLRIALYNY